MQAFDLVSPSSRQEAIELLAGADEGTRVIAGGTGLINLIKQRLAGPERLVSLHRVTDLGDITWQDDHVEIGALQTLYDLQQDAQVRAHIPILQKILSEVASPRIRSMATLGGACGHADPNQDTPLALLALDATVIVESAKGKVEVPIDAFYIDYYETALTPDQLITAVRIPLPAATSRFIAKKFMPGSLEDYACVNVCIKLDLDADSTCRDARVVLGSVGPTVFRARKAEASLVGRKVDAAAAAEAAKAAADATDPVDDARGSAGYKRRMAEVWVRRCIERAIEA